jgi:Ring finger domain
MIILYSLTSMITVLLLVVIIGGAIKARRHPERYGPRAFIGRPRQSRAKGIAIAMLETLPIVRFGDPDPKQTKAIGPDKDVEMTPVAKEATIIEKETMPKESLKEAGKDTTDIGADLPARNPITQQSSIEEAATSSVTESPAVAAAEQSDAPTDTNDTPGCSICTEDFMLGEQLRVLPCDHKFHPLCVDPWLLNVSGTCPLCRIDLRPPQELADETAIPIIPTIRLPTPDVPQRRSTIGGIMRGTRGLDLPAIREASREERIRILRRWREERRRQQPEPGTSNADSDTQRRSRPLSQWFRDRSSSARNSTGPDLQPARTRSNANGPRTHERRPSTWYAGEAEQAPQLSPVANADVTLNERARSWYGDAGGAAPEESALDLARRRTPGIDTGTEGGVR